MLVSTAGAPPLLRLPETPAEPPEVVAPPKERPASLPTMPPPHEAVRSNRHRLAKPKVLNFVVIVNAVPENSQRWLQRPPELVRLALLDVNIYAGAVRTFGRHLEAPLQFVP